MSRHAAAGLACPTSLPQTQAEAAATAVAGGKQGKFVQAAYADKVSVSRGTAWGMWQAACCMGHCVYHIHPWQATTMSVFQLPIALASHACAPLSLVAACDTLPSPSPPPVATIFGQITCFKVPLAKPASQAKPTRLKSCHSVFQLCLATCDHRRCQFGPLQLGLHLRLCRCRCGVLSSANCSRRYYPGASISKQLTDAASEPVKQRDERTD